MKRIPTIFFAIILCPLAKAEWQAYSQTSDGFFYIDLTRIKDEGIYRSAWDLMDFKILQPDGSNKSYKSQVSKKIVDCKNSRFAIGALYNYSEQMGKGELVNWGNYQIKESEWASPPPNSAAESMIKIACYK